MVMLLGGAYASIVTLSRSLAFTETAPSLVADPTMHHATLTCCPEGIGASGGDSVHAAPPLHRFPTDKTLG